MSASAISRQFHTVVIRGDLPTVKKEYEANQPMDLPEADYWIRQVATDVTDGRWYREDSSGRFKMQHIISNGPRKSFICRYLTGR